MAQLSQVVPGVWPNELASAFLYGLGLLGIDYCLGRLRLRTARRLARTRLGSFLVFTFLLRLAIFVAGAGLAARLFEPAGLFVVCLLLLLAVPLGILTGIRAVGAERRGKD